MAIPGKLSESEFYQSEIKRLVDELNRQKKLKEDGIKRLKKLKSILLKKIEMKEKDISCLVDQLDERDREIEELKNYQGVLLERDEVLTNCHDDMYEEIERLKKKNDSLLRAIKLWAKKYDSLNDKYYKLKDIHDQSYGKTAHEIERLLKEKYELADENKDLKEALEKANKTIGDFQKENNKLWYDKKVYQERINHLVDDCISWGKQYDKLLNQKYEELKEELFDEIVNADPESIHKFVVDFFDRALHGPFSGDCDGDEFCGKPCRRACDGDRKQAERESEAEEDGNG